MESSTAIRRAARLVGHVSAASAPRSVPLFASPCIGESQNQVVDERDATRFERIPLKLVFPDKSAKDERYAGSGDFVVVEGELLRPPSKSKTVIVFMHPSAISNLLPMPLEMAKMGLHVTTCTSRYPNNDSALIMEKVALDLGAFVRLLKSDKWRYERVVLGGWSGGGALSTFYQSQAEKPSVFRTPAGEPIDFSKLIPADALLVLAAHSSRARIFTEWLDPAVVDENDPEARDPELDLWNPKNVPPFSAEFLARFRAAQLARSQRITRWVEAKLAEIAPDASDNSSWKQARTDFPFSVRCTQADPLRLDLSIEPNGRTRTTLRELAQENHSPVGLARFTTLKSWLSQWSIERSQADGPAHMARVTCPVLVLCNGADHLVPRSHADAMFAAVKHERKQFLFAREATHYYFGQRPLLRGVIGDIAAFLVRHGLLEDGLVKHVNNSASASASAKT